MEFEPILILDNEFENVSDLIDLLSDSIRRRGHYGEFVFYCESAEEASELMIERMKIKRGLSAMIVDNHLYGLDGEDFLRIVNGRVGYCISKDRRHLNLDLNRFYNFEELYRVIGKNNAISDFIEGVFSNDYTLYLEFLKWWNNEERKPLQIMLCGHPSYVDLAGLEDVFLIRKQEGCEREILSFLEENGIFNHNEIESAYNNHPRFSAEDKRKNEYNPCCHRIKKKKRRIRFDEL